MNPDKTNQINSFWETGIGPWLGGVLVIVGVLVLVFALFKAIPKFIAGKFGDGIKPLLGGLVVAALCFEPTLLTNLVGLAQDLLQQGSETVENPNGTGGSGGSGGDLG